MLVPGEVDHPGQFLGSAPALGLGLGRHVMPHVLVHAESGDVIEAGLVGGHRGQQWADRPPYRPPGRAQHPGEAGDRGVFAAQLSDHPPARPDGQQRPGPGQLGVLLGKSPGGAVGVRASPGALAPHQLDRTAEARGVDQHHVPAAVRGGEHPADRAAHRLGGRLDDHPKAAVDSRGHGQDMEAGQPDEHVAAVAVTRIRTRARVTTRRRLGHRRGLPVWLLGRSRSWKVSTHPGAEITAAGRSPPPQVRRASFPREPLASRPSPPGRRMRRTPSRPSGPSRRRIGSATGGCATSASE